MADRSHRLSARELADAAERNGDVRRELFLRGRYEGVTVPEATLAEVDAVMVERARARSGRRDDAI